ncbi:TPA: hypothetical protein DDZ86_02025 [Candidatus Dependentiae bacterium]|nr:hypothetical protein [Candidatus Dependentiae bacterium]
MKTYRQFLPLSLGTQAHALMRVLVIATITTFMPLGADGEEFVQLAAALKHIAKMPAPEPKEDSAKKLEEMYKPEIENAIDAKKALDATKHCINAMNTQMLDLTEHSETVDHFIEALAKKLDELASTWYTGFGTEEKARGEITLLSENLSNLGIDVKKLDKYKSLPKPKIIPKGTEKLFKELDDSTTVDKTKIAFETAIKNPKIAGTPAAKISLVETLIDKMKTFSDIEKESDLYKNTLTALIKLLPEQSYIKKLDEAGKPKATKTGKPSLTASLDDDEKMWNEWAEELKKSLNTLSQTTITLKIEDKDYLSKKASEFAPYIVKTADNLKNSISTPPSLSNFKDFRKTVSNPTQSFWENIIAPKDSVWAVNEKDLKELEKIVTAITNLDFSTATEDDIKFLTATLTLFAQIQPRKIKSFLNLLDSKTAGKAFAPKYRRQLESDSFEYAISALEKGSPDLINKVYAGTGAATRANEVLERIISPILVFINTSSDTKQAQDMLNSGIETEPDSRIFVDKMETLTIRLRKLLELLGDATKDFGLNNEFLKSLLSSEKNRVWCTSSWIVLERTDVSDKNKIFYIDLFGAAKESTFDDKHDSTHSAKNRLTALLKSYEKDILRYLKYLQYRLSTPEKWSKIKIYSLQKNVVEKLDLNNFNLSSQPLNLQKAILESFFLPQIQFKNTASKLIWEKEQEKIAKEEETQKLTDDQKTKNKYFQEFYVDLEEIEKQINQVENPNSDENLKKLSPGLRQITIESSINNIYNFINSFVWYALDPLVCPNCFDHIKDHLGSSGVTNLFGKITNFLKKQTTLEKGFRLKKAKQALAGIKLAEQMQEKYPELDGNTWSKNDWDSNFITQYGKIEFASPLLQDSGTLWVRLHEKAAVDEFKKMFQA